MTRRKSGSKATSESLPSRRSPCPVACTLDILGDKWSLLVIRDLFAGKRRFRDLVASPEGIATNILASRIERLAEAGLIAADASPERAGSSEYRLTGRGESLLPLLTALRDWGLEHIPGTRAKISVAQRSSRRAPESETRPTARGPRS